MPSFPNHSIRSLRLSAPLPSLVPLLSFFGWSFTSFLCAAFQSTCACIVCHTALPLFGGVCVCAPKRAPSGPPIPSYKKKDTTNTCWHSILLLCDAFGPVPPNVCAQRGHAMEWGHTGVYHSTARHIVQYPLLRKKNNNPYQPPKCVPAQKNGVEARPHPNHSPCSRREQPPAHPPPIQTPLSSSGLLRSKMKGSAGGRAALLAYMPLSL